MRAGVKTFVYTSTIDVSDRTLPNYDETSCNPDMGLFAYERSKIEAQKVVDTYAERLSVRSLHPCAIYGPGAVRPTGLTAALWSIRHNKLRSIPPGGLPVVFNHDLAVAQIAVADQAGNSNAYIVCERFYTLREIAEEITRIYANVVMPNTINPLALAAAVSLAPLYRWVGRTPPISFDTIRTLTRYCEPSTAKICRELGWLPTPLSEGLRQTLTA